MDKPGQAANANRTPTPIDAFQKYFTIDMVNLIVRHTNSKITSMLSHVSEETQRKYNFLQVTSEIEMKALIGLILYRGLYKLNNFTATKLFSDKYGPPMFGAVMRRDRFFFPMSTMTFDDKSTRAERWKFDRFTAVRGFLEMFNEECMSCLIACDYLSLDETLYPMRTQISFKQYNPNKPAKYGLIFKSINAARYPYTYITAPYAGKPQEEGDDFYYPGTECITKKSDFSP